MTTLAWATAALPALLLGAPPCLAQSPDAFEVLSVKPNVSTNPAMSIQLPPGGVNGVNVTPLLLMRYAFDLPDARIVDVPEWATRSRFDIIAKAPADKVTSDMRPMVRALLRERFGLVTRLESRPMQVFALRRAGDPRVPRLVAATGRCLSEVDTPARRSGALSSDERCGLSIAFGRVAGGEIPIAELARGLGTLTGSVVLDRTGMVGLYTFTLEYTPDAVALDPATAKEFPAIDPNGPPLATALREQLGLQWTTDTAPVDVLVVERVRPPDPD